MSLTLDTLRAEGWLAHPITWAQWLTLPEDEESPRLECQEGVVQVVPSPEPRHQFAGLRLAGAVQRALPTGWLALTDCDVRILEDPLTVRRPDVLVVPDSVLARGHRILAEEVRLAVEITSPGSRRVDRILKTSEYADAHIPDYGILDLDAPSLSMLRLDADGGYQPRTTVTGVGSIEVCGVVVELDLSTLLAP